MCVTHMCFATACLSIGKAGGHAPLKDGLHQRPGCEPVHHLIGCEIIKGVVKAEGLVLQVAGHVKSLSGFVDYHHIFTGNGYNIQLFHYQFFLVQWTLPHTNTYSCVRFSVIEFLLSP